MSAGPSTIRSVTTPGTDHEPGTGGWDVVAAELGALRRRAGDPSYAEIGRRVAEQRVRDGADPHAARVARTTVYDVFRTGRTRLNLPLVREIAHALGGGDPEVDAWVARSLGDRPAEVPTAGATAGATADATAGTPDPAPPPPPPRSPRAHLLALLVACVALNLAGRGLVVLLDLPVHLDMVGTALAAIALGPWHGAGVGLVTNVLGVAEGGPASLPFALVNVAGALVWGYGVRRLGLGRTLPRFLGLNLLVAAVCTLLAVPILVLLLGGSTGHEQDTLAATVTALTSEAAVGTWAANLLVSVGDKLISGFVALVAVSALPAGLRRLDLPLLGPARPVHDG